ncbi:MAG: hypothetical protein JAZ11_02680 [Candidatus Thiodiazotropha lotti]|nr:hypothetical protein [Candidatus Thiodiazotropha lotti]
MDGFDRIIHLRATEKCDLRCKHCFVPPNATVMDENQIIDQVEAVLATMQQGRDCSCNLSAFPPSMEVRRILLQWHGGEPTLLPPVMVSRIISQLNSSAQRQGLHLHHGIQTNLTALYKSGELHKSGWIQLLVTAFDPDQIGVSFDFGLRGYMAEAIFEFALKEIMTDQEIQPWVTMTLARPLYERLMDDPLSVLKRFGRVRGIRFEPLSPHGYAKDHWDEIGINHDQHHEAMIQVLGVWWPRRAYLPEISPLGEMLGSLQGEASTSACLGQRSIAMTEINRHGTHGRCIALQGNPPIPSIPLSCLHCEWQAVCGNGCPALPLLNGGDCRGGASLWCACQQAIQQSQTTQSGTHHG